MNIKELNEAIDKALKEDGNGLLKLSDNLINRLTFGYLGSEDKLPRFNSLEDLEEFIKSTNSFPDNFFYQDALFTMDEYDMDGKYLSYGCPQLDKGITVRTPDGRYNYKGNYAELEMEIEESDGWSYRFDLTYYLPKEVYLALYNKSESSKKSIKEGTGIFHGKTLAKVPREEWIGKIITIPYDKADYEIVKLDDDANMAVLKNIETGETTRMGYKGLQNPYGYMYYLQGTGIEESVDADKKSVKEEMEYNRKIWDLFEENIAEYLNEHGVKPEGNNVMNYISENAAEIVKAVLEKEYNYEEDDQAIFELYYNCPIHFTDKAQAIDKLLEEYLAESLKRCLTIEDKLLQISSLDKNESVIEKKSIKEDVNTVYVLINNKVALNFEQDFNFATEVLDADGLKRHAEELDKNFEQNAKEANLGSPLMNDVLYAIKILRNNGYFVLVKNIKSI